MKITDGKRTIEITIREWNGSGWGPDWSNDYFNAGLLPYDEETDTHTVASVAHCIEMATDWHDPDSACYAEDQDGNPICNEDMCINITEINE